MVHRCILFVFSALLLPANALAQEAPAPQQTSQPVSPSRSLPSDFQLPPGESQNASLPRNEPVVQALPVTPSPTPSPTTPSSQGVIEPDEVESVPPATVIAEPAAQSEPQEVGRAQPAAAAPNETVASEPEVSIEEPVSAPSPTSMAEQPQVADTAEAWSLTPWLFGGGLLAILALCFLWLRNRRPRGATEQVVEAPKLERHSADDEADVEEPQAPNLPKPTFARREYDPASLVSTRPRSMPQTITTPPVAPAPAGTVTTNLAAKLRAQREAEERQRMEMERQRKEAEQLRKASRPAVTQSISFDWS